MAHEKIKEGEGAEERKRLTVKNTSNEYFSEKKFKTRRNHEHHHQNTSSRAQHFIERWGDV